MDIFLAILERYGIPLAALALLCLAIVHVWRFFTKEIVIPLRDNGLARLVKFFDRLDDTLTHMEKWSTAANSVANEHYGVSLSIKTQLGEVEQLCEEIYTQVTGQSRRRRSPRPASLLQPPEPHGPKRPGVTDG